MRQQPRARSAEHFAPAAGRASKQAARAQSAERGHARRGHSSNGLLSQASWRILRAQMAGHPTHAQIITTSLHLLLSRIRWQWAVLLPLEITAAYRCWP